ncbi:hypothetical protein [Paenibacillus sp. Z3-2]
MTNRTHAIKFLQNHDLWKQALNITSEGTVSPSLLNELKHIEGSEATGRQLDLGLYRLLADEYDRYLQEEHLDYISLVITGVDDIPFSSDNGKHLIGKARRRIDSSLFGSRIHTYEDNFGITVLWFPTMPISFSDFEPKQVGTIRSNLKSYFVDVLGLLVEDVSLSIIDGGGGREDWFYDHYFVPRKITDIFKGSGMLLPSYDPKGKKTIMGYIREDNLEKLKAVVKSQLPTPLGFDINLPDKFEASIHTVFFMPTFRISLNVQLGQSAGEIIQLVSQHIDVLESMVFDGRIYLECMSSEGPFANTVSDIVINIQEILNPYVIRVLDELSLEVLSILFILTNTEY